MNSTPKPRFSEPYLQYQQKKQLGYRFASMTAIFPQIKELIDIDRMSGLKLLVIWRQMLFDLQLADNKSKGKVWKNVSEFQIIQGLNMRIYRNYTNTFLYLKDSSAFLATARFIVKMVFMTIVDNMNQSERLKFLEKVVNESQVFSVFIGDYFEEGSNDEVIELAMQLLESEKRKLEAKKTKQKIEKQQAVKDEEIVIGELPVAESPKETNPDELLSRKAVMAYYNISAATLHRWEKLGSIPKAVRKGGKVYWRKSDIVEDPNKKQK